MAKEAAYTSLDSAKASSSADSSGQQHGASGEKTIIESSGSEKEGVSHPEKNAWLYNTWTLELLSAFMGCLLIVALGLILQAYHGKAPPHFGLAFGSAVGLNTVVSILSTAIEAFLLYPLAQSISQLKWQWMYHKHHRLRDLDVFDQASRGVTGSLALLWKLRWGTIASLGAILTIYAITVDAFSQQLILFASRAVPVSGVNSTILTAFSWKDSTRVGAAIRGSGVWQEESISAEFLSPGMKGAIQTGLFSGSQTLNATLPFCPTGNCTFDPFLTLGVCGSVANVSQHLTISKVPAVYHGMPVSVPRYSLNSQNYIDAGFRSAIWLMNISSAASFSFDVFGTVNNMNSVAFRNVNDPIADFFVFAQNDALTYWAYEFVLEWCVREYNVSVLNGEVTNQVTEIFRNFTSHGDFDGVTGGPLDVGGGQGFLIDPGTQTALQLYFEFLVSGSVSQPSEDFRPVVSSDAIQALFEPFYIGGGSSTVPNNPSIGGNEGSGIAGLQNIVDNVATGMSNYIRQDRPTQVQGIVYHQTTVTLVRFQWIAPLVVFAGLTLVLLAVTIAMQQSSALRGEAWKSSTLPLLHAVEPGLQAELGGLLGLSGIMAQDKEVMVRLVRSGDDGGWRLVGG